MHAKKNNCRRLIMAGFGLLMNTAVASHPSMTMKVGYDHNLLPEHAASRVETVSSITPPGLISQDGAVNGSLSFFTTSGTLAYTVCDKIVDPEAGSIVLWLKLPAGVEYQGYPRILDVACKDGFMFIGLCAKQNWLYAGYGDNKNFSVAKIADIPQDGNWHQVAVTWSKPDKSFGAYMDGKPIRKVPLKGEVIQPEQIYIGTDKRGNNRIAMFLDELAVYNQALSAEEIAGMYKDQAPRTSGRTEGGTDAVASNLAEGMEYLVSTEFPLPPDIRFAYPDNAEKGKLTDGVTTREHWRENLAVGWIRQGKISIAFELPQPVRIGMVRCHAIGGGGGGVYFPREIAVYAGDSPSNLVFAGAARDHPEESGSGTTLAWLVIDCVLEEPVKYIKIEVVADKADAWVMLDEIEIYPQARQQTTPEMFSRSGLHDFYPPHLQPTSHFKLGFVYFGQTSLWPAPMHMQKMREMGFNIVHSEVNTYWGGTGWNALEPSKRQFNWIPLDKYVNSALEAGLFTPIMIGIEGRIPAWLLEEYPDAAFINPYGEKVPGLVDFGHPGVIEELEYYLKAMVKRYRHAPNIIGYIIGDEYSIYQNYYHKKNLAAQNFNPRMQYSFRSFIQQKYVNIDNFNRLASSSYRDFNDVTPQLAWLTDEGYRVEWREWSLFREVESMRVYRIISESIKRESPEAKIILSAVGHNWPYHAESGVDLGLFPGLNVYAAKNVIGDNPDSLLAIPLWGKLLAGMPFREFWFSNLSFMSKTLPNSPNCHVRGIFEAIGSNVKGLIYFMWDTRYGERQWGSAACNGPAFLYQDKQSYVKSPELVTVNKLTPFLAQYGNILAEAQAAPPQVGILLPYNTYHHELKNSISHRSLASKRYPSHAVSTAIGPYRRVRQLAAWLLRRNYEIAGFSESAAEQAINDYPACSLVGNNFLGDRIVEKVSRYMDSGGILIIDANTGKFDEHGMIRDKSLVEILEKHRERILLIEECADTAAEQLSAFFAEFELAPPIRVAPENIKAGAYLLSFNHRETDGAVIVLVNRDSYGKVLKNLSLVVNRGLIPSSADSFIEISPYPELRETAIHARVTKKELEIPIADLNDVKVILISNRKIADDSDLQTNLPRYKRYPWWNQEWQFRLPLTIYRSDETKVNLDLDLNKIMSEREFDEIPELNSLRLVKQFPGKPGKPVPLEVVKCREFNRLNNFNITLRFAPGKIDSQNPSSDFYLYFDSRDIEPDAKYCKIAEKRWKLTENKGVEFYFANACSDIDAPVIFTRNGLILSSAKLSQGFPPVKVYLIGRDKYLKASRQRIVFGNKVVDRMFCDYNRMVYLGEIVPCGKDNRLTISFDQQLLEIETVVIAPVDMDCGQLARLVPQKSTVADIATRFVERRK